MSWRQADWSPGTRARRVVAATAGALIVFALGGCCDRIRVLAILAGDCGEMRATLEVEPATVKTGESVSLTGRAVTRGGERWGTCPADDPDFECADNRPYAQGWAFDYDGIGGADYTDELRRGSVVETNWSYSQPGVFHPSVMVIGRDVENYWQRATATTQVTATAPPGAANQPPVAGITAPRDGQAGKPVAFDGSTSYDPDPDGKIVQYQWDFEWDPENEGTDATGPTATHEYPRPGTYTARLVVTDDRGATGSATHQINIGGDDSIPGAARTAVGPRPFTATLLGRPLGRIPPSRERGTIATVRDVRGAGVVSSRLGGRRRAADRALRGLLRGTWRTRMTARLNLRTLVGRLKGIALARPARPARRARRRESGCIAFSVAATPFGSPRGTLRLLGGTGRYAPLRVQGTLLSSVSGTKIRLTGSVRMQRGSPRGLPRRCRALRQSR